MKRLLVIFGALLLITAGAFGQTTDISCGIGLANPWVISNPGSCHIAPSGYIDSGEAWNFRGDATGVLSGSAFVLSPTGADHSGWALVSQTPYSVMKFTEELQFGAWNGYNIVMVWQNNTGGGTCPGAPCLNFGAGAGGEAGFYQGAGGPNYAQTNVAGVLIDGYSPLTQSGSFSCNSLNWYESQEVPYLPNVNTAGYLASYTITKTCTSPVVLNNPSGTAGAPNSDTFDLKTVYDHTTGTMVVTLYDVTAGGSCGGTPVNCLTATFNGVWLPEIVGSPTAYTTISAGTSGGAQAPTGPNLINSLSYIENTPSTPTYSYTSASANSNYNNGVPSAFSPTYSPSPGTYGSAQTVTIGTSGTPHNYSCVALVTTITATTLFPHPDNNGGCVQAAAFTGSISGTTLIVSSVTGPIAVGQTINGSGVTAATVIVSGSGSTWTVNNSQTVISEAMTSNLGTVVAPGGTFTVGASGNLLSMAGSSNQAFGTGVINPTGLGSPSTLVNGVYTIGGGSTAPTQVTPIIISQLKDSRGANNAGPAR